MKILLSTVAIALFATTANAAPKNVIADCDFTSWKGATQQKFSQSWLGMGFIVQKDQQRILFKAANGKLTFLPVTKVKKAKKFTTYKAKMVVNNTRGAVTYRVYNDKKARGIIDFPGYHLMSASGSCK